MKKTISALKDIIFSYLIIYFTTILSIIINIIITKNLDIIKNLATITKYSIIAMTITIIPITIFLYRKNHQKELPIKTKLLLLMIPLGATISLVYNNLTINLTPNQSLTKIPLVIVILYTSILGPIFEEILFRYDTYNKLQKIYNFKIATILTSIVFALLHSGIITIIYAFILGLILCYVYKKTKNILYPILLHISANFASIFITKYNLLTLLISIIVLLSTLYLIKKCLRKQ